MTLSRKIPVVIGRTSVKLATSEWTLSIVSMKCWRDSWLSTSTMTNMRVYNRIPTSTRSLVSSSANSISFGACGSPVLRAIFENSMQPRRDIRQFGLIPSRASRLPFGKFRRWLMESFPVDGTTFRDRLLSGQQSSTTMLPGGSFLAWRVSILSFAERLWRSYMERENPPWRMWIFSTLTSQDSKSERSGLGDGGMQREEFSLFLRLYYFPFIFLPVL